jgi:hypothetical protein
MLSMRRLVRAGRVSLWRCILLILAPWYIPVMGGQIYDMIGPDGELIAVKVGTSIYLHLLQT